MSKKAEERAMNAYPPLPVKQLLGMVDYDANRRERIAYQRGYEQTEKDILSLIQSRIDEILGDAQPNPILRMELKELIKKIEA